MTYVEQYCSCEPPPHTSAEFQELCASIMCLFGLHMPHTVTEALDLYLELTEIIDIL